MSDPDTISFNAGATTIVGRVRTANEDAVMSTPTVIGVADGMGGHAAGEVASAEAVRVLQFAVEHRRLDELVAAVHYANRSIFERASDDPALEGMGTTLCTAGVLIDDETTSEHNAVGILNVGDSRAYLFAAGELQQLSEDHSYVASLVRSGAISEEEAENHPRRNVVTRALGIEPLVIIDTWILSPRQGDRLLLCSDGLTNEVRDNDIREVLARVADPQVAADELAQLADANGGRDNISVVVADIMGPLEHAAPPNERFRRFATPAVDPDILDIPDDERHDESDIVDNRLATLEHPIVVPSDPLPVSETANDDAAVLISEEEIAALSEPPAGTTGDSPGSGDADRGDDALSDHESDALSGLVVNGEHDADELDDAPSIKEDEEGELVERIEQPKRSWWRIIVFLLALLGLLGLGFWLVWANNQAGWYVKDNDGTVALFEGDPNGFLWMAPQIIREFEIETKDLETQAQVRLVDGVRHDTQQEAEAYADRLSSMTTTTTSTSSTTSTTVPPTTLPEPSGLGDEAVTETTAVSPPAPEAGP